MRVSGQNTFTVPAGAGSYAPERITIACPEGRVFNRVSVVPDNTVAAAVVELWALKAGGDPANDAHFFFAHTVSQS